MVNVCVEELLVFTDVDVAVNVYVEVDEVDTCDCCLGRRGLRRDEDEDEDRDRDRDRRFGAIVANYKDRQNKEGV